VIIRIVLCNLFYFNSKKIFMSHSSVKKYPSEPSFMDLTKVLISFIELLTIIQSSMNVMIIIHFLKFKQVSIADG
jgi:hypothetical protein